MHKKAARPRKKRIAPHAAASRCHHSHSLHPSFDPCQAVQFIDRLKCLPLNNLVHIKRRVIGKSLASTRRSSAFTWVAIGIFRREASTTKKQMISQLNVAFTFILVLFILCALRCHEKLCMCIVWQRELKRNAFSVEGKMVTFRGVYF